MRFLLVLFLVSSCVAQREFEYEDFSMQSILPYESYSTSNEFNKFVADEPENALFYAEKTLGNSDSSHYWMIFSGLFQLYNNSYISYIVNGDSEYNKKIKSLLCKSLNSNNDQLVKSSLAFLYWHLDLLDEAMCETLAVLADSNESDIKIISNSILAEIFLPPNQYFKDCIRRIGGEGKEKILPIGKISTIIKSSSNKKAIFVLSARFPGQVRKPVIED